MLELKDLPDKYIESMRELLGDEFNEYLESLGKRHVSGLRVNNLKRSNEELLKQVETLKKALSDAQGTGSEIPAKKAAKEQKTGDTAK